MDAIKDFINIFGNPRYFFLLSLLALVFIVWKREVFAKTAMGYGLMAFLVVFFGFGLFDENFRLIIAKPDNVPIVALIFLIIFFTWYSMRQAVLNDRRIAAGDEPIEKQESGRVWVWPDLVYTELIALILCSVVLVVWSILLEAPIEQPANPANTPNPSKAPWYFLGLQEMLVYFDPWLAGVVLPSLIVVGLMAIPYIDTNPKGNGYYTFSERKAEITLFLFGVRRPVVVTDRAGHVPAGGRTGISLGRTSIGTFISSSLSPTSQLSEYIWVRGLGRPLPENWLIREFFGILLVLAYITVVPVTLAKTVLRSYYEKLGPRAVLRHGVPVPDDALASRSKW